MKCPNCDGKGEVEDPEENKTSSSIGGVVTLIFIGLLVFFMAGFMRDCSHMHLGAGMCGLVGIEAVVPLSILWLFRKLK